MTKKWDETGMEFLEEQNLFDETQAAKLNRANRSGLPELPIPTRVISNGEYMPPPQSADQKRVEQRIHELSEAASRKLGMDRRRFLKSAGGSAAAFIAMNEVFGRFFNVDRIEMFESAAAAEAGPPRDLFVFDDQLHFVRPTSPPGLYHLVKELRALAQGPTAATSDIKSNSLNPKAEPDETGESWGVWNPALVGLPNAPENYQLVQFIKDIYLDSQVTVGLLSNITGGVITPPGEKAPRPPRNYLEARAGEQLTAKQTVAARNFVNEISGSTRMLAHGLLYVGKGNLAYLQQQIDENEPDSFKGYNISAAAKVDNDPNSLMRPWRHDDESVAYPSFELIEKNYRRLKATRPGLNNICVHKGLEPIEAEGVKPWGHPSDLPKAARDWPGLNFITYHSAIRPFFFMRDSFEEVQSGKLREGVPDIRWTTEFAQLCAPYSNCYAELGTTWASTIVSFPTVAAHILGQLLKYFGPDRILFGSDSVWYGSPQWQIEALWRFQIPQELRQRYGYPELTESAKRKILGLNSARLYGIRGVEKGLRPVQFKPLPTDYEKRMTPDFKSLMEMPGYVSDQMAKFRAQYLAMGATPEHSRHGWIM